MAYKKDQGRMARMAAFWSLAILVLWGARSLDTQLGVWWREALGTRLGTNPDGTGGLFLPVLDVDITWAFLISVSVAIAGVFLLHRWLEKPKNADLLIDTESELRKVTWPTIKDVINTSLVVVFCVIFLMAFLAGSDVLIARVTGILLFGRGA